jgi:hypothetical protein
MFDLLSTVMWCWGYCVANEWMTGTVIATSPMAESRMTNILAM